MSNVTTQSAYFMEKIREVMRWSTSCVQRSLSFDCFVTGPSFMLDTHTHTHALTRTHTHTQPGRRAGLCAAAKGKRPPPRALRIYDRLTIPGSACETR